MKEMKPSKGDLILHKPELRHQEQTAALHPRTGLWESRVRPLITWFQSLQGKRLLFPLFNCSHDCEESKAASVHK